ncbi:MAG: radical SAM protein [Spirochaetales bacterium]|nr:radical SAM protein [Spirochaetales bacterium]
MKKITLSQSKTAKKFQFSKKIDFVIPVGKLPGKSKDRAVVLILYIEQIGFMLPEGSLQFEDNSYEIVGYQTEVEIYLSDKDQNLEFSLTTPSGVVKLAWWLNGRNVLGREKARIFIYAKKDHEYNAALHCYFTWRCNFSCKYCFIYADDPKRLTKSSLSEIQTDKFMKVLNNTGKTFSIVFSGGEPFLIPHFVETCAELSKDHYVSVATNLSLTREINKFMELLNPDRVRFILASFHIMELEKRNMIDVFFENYKNLKKAGFQVSAQTVGYPPLLESIEKYMKLFAKKNMDLQCAPFIGDYENKPYPASYSDEDLERIKYEGELVKSAYTWQGKKCNAGYNDGVVKTNGDVFYCMFSNEKIGNVYKGITFRDEMIRCPIEFCSLPLSIEDYSLYRDAIDEGA